MVPTTDQAPACARPLKNIFSKPQSIPAIICILQLRELRLREVNGLAYQRAKGLKRKY